MKYFEIDKKSSATSRLAMPRRVSAISSLMAPRAGDVVVVRALSESSTYGNLELPSGRLAKINSGDVLLGVLGKRRALKGFVGEIPDTVNAGDQLHLLNMGGLIGKCSGHHSSLTDAIEVEVLGAAVDETGLSMNIENGALLPEDSLQCRAPIVLVAGSCMNSGKTVAAVEIIKQASQAGLRVAGAKLTGVACLRDTLNMEDHGAIATASFLDCGLPSTVDVANLPAVAKAILNNLDQHDPDLIVAELGDGIIGGYGVDAILKDQEITGAVQCLTYCAADYVGVVGGKAVLDALGIEIDVVAGSVTDSQMGEDFVRHEFGLAAGNARRNGRSLFELVRSLVNAEVAFA